VALLVLAAVLIGCTPSTPGPSSETSSSRPSSPSTAAEPSATAAESSEPIVQALAYVPIGASTFAFTDWVALKASQGLSDLTSAATDDERGTFLRSLSVVNSADTPFSMMAANVFFAKGLLTHWGFDNLDLDWEASISGSFGVASVLRLRDDFDLAPVVSRFDERDFTTSTVEGVTVRSHELANEEWVLQADLSFLNVALMPDGRTLVLSPRPDPIEQILAHRGELTGSGGPPVVLDAAAALDHPSGAWLSFELDRLCNAEARARPDALESVQQLLADAGPLHPYTLVAVGYRADLDPAGRIVFGYVDPADATADLDGRRTLATDGPSLELAVPIADRFFSVADATVDGGSLILRVGPPAVADLPSGVRAPTVPRLLLNMAIRADMIFAACDPSL
jgi:hypothetical protein